jgi:hypothetical protein
MDPEGRRLCPDQMTEIRLVPVEMLDAGQSMIRGTVEGREGVVLAGREAIDRVLHEIGARTAMDLGEATELDAGYLDSLSLQSVNARMSQWATSTFAISDVRMRVFGLNLSTPKKIEKNCTRRRMKMSFCHTPLSV